MLTQTELKALNERTVYVGDPGAYPLDDEMIEILREESAPLQEAFPADFDRYLNLFYKFFPKQSVHVRTFYSGGFVCPKRKLKSGDQIDQSCYPDMIARHLDLDRWQHNHPKSNYPEHYWVAMREPKKASLKAIDFDNKENVLAFYCTHGFGGRIVHRPLPILTVEHFQAIKRIYDAFPNHIWCVSSATLGLHIWQKYVRPMPLHQIDSLNRPTLARIGLGNTEIHPMIGRAFRRPFGEDYFTITPDGLLDDWRKQLDYFENDARTPPFEVVFESLRQLMVQEWGRYQGSFEGKLRPSSKHPELARKHFHFGRWSSGLLDDVLTDLDQWATNGFSIAAFQSTFVSATAAKKHVSSNSAGIWTYKFDGDWVQKCKEWAIQGLPAEDSMTFVVLHLARWFLHIEFFGQEDRFDRTVEVLEHYCKSKHNGFISRLNQGLLHEVVQHVRRIVANANKPLTNERAKVFEEIRGKRANGTYKTNYHLEPLIRGPNEDTEASTVSSSVLFTLCSTLSGSDAQDVQGGNLTAKELRQQQAKTWNPVFDDRPLPESLKAKILGYYAGKDIRIKKPTIVAITRFLRHISTNPDGRRLSHQALKKFGFSNDRTRRHLGHLQLLGLIAIVAACPSAGISKCYSLTELGRQLIESETATAT